MLRPGKFLQKLLTIFISVFACAELHAQVAFPVVMTLTDKSSGEPVGFATVSMTTKGVDEPLKYTMSDADGKAAFDGIVRGTYIMKAEIMGYLPYEQEVIVNKNIDLGIIKMTPDVEMLEAAGISYAMANAVPGIAEHADYVTDSVEDVLEEILRSL